MIKKIIIIAVIILTVTSTTFAFSATGSVETNTNITESTPNQKLDPTGLMIEFNGLVDDVKKDECMCTLEYAPVCGQQDGDQITFGNKCEFNCRAKKTKIKFLHKGKCKEKNNSLKQLKLIKPSKENLPIPVEIKVDPNINIESYNTGITGGIKGINNKIPTMEIKMVDGWVEVDGNFSFNIKTKEWKDAKGICHTCTIKNGFTKDGKIMIDGKIDASIDTSITLERQNQGNFIRKFNVKISNEQNDFSGDSKKKSEKIISFGGKNFSFEGDSEVRIKDNALFLGKSEVKVDPETAEIKAKSSAFADIVISTKIKEDDGKVNYIVETQKTGKFLGLFDFNLGTEVKIDVETGVVIEIDEPWYSFLVF